MREVHREWWEKVADAWKEYRPTYYRLLKEHGYLKREAQGYANQMGAVYRRLLERGMGPGEAAEQVFSEYLYHPEKMEEVEEHLELFEEEAAFQEEELRKAQLADPKDVEFHEYLETELEDARAALAGVRRRIRENEQRVMRQLPDDLKEKLGVEE